MGHLEAKARLATRILAPRRGAFRPYIPRAMSPDHDSPTASRASQSRSTLVRSVPAISLFSTCVAACLSCPQAMTTVWLWLATKASCTIRARSSNPMFRATPRPCLRLLVFELCVRVMSAARIRLGPPEGCDGFGVTADAVSMTLPDRCIIHGRHHFSRSVASPCLGRGHDCRRRGQAAIVCGVERD